MSVPERAERAEATIRRLLVKGVKGVVTFQTIPQGYAVMLDGVLVFMITPEDADSLKPETPQEVARNAAAALALVVRETGELHNMSALLRAAGFAVAATALLLFLGWILHRAKTWLVTRLSTLAQNYSEKLSVGGETIVQRERIIVLVSRIISLIYWLVTALLLFHWIGFVLGRFPYTRPWGEQLTQYLIKGAFDISARILGVIPGILVAALIFLLAKFINNLLKTVFERIEKGSFEIAGLDRDTVRPTRKLVAAAVWIFALAMAYPYLPGSETAAFKGLSVLVGLMISLGASSLVGQAASGLILMYTRTLRPGEYVQIAAHEGTVVELGLFATRVRTGLGEELTLPNSLILGNVTRNYSRAVHGQGYIITTSVTIGYDTPWRQVHAMLLEAAQRTGGVLTDPAPQVFQTALSDFYPEYRLVCQAVPSEPSPRAQVMNALHANIQDVFNEYGVQIMSPHYLGDPGQPKWVPKDKWCPPPARQDG
jgi:small-conductance mechanosensitive channel